MASYTTSLFRNITPSRPHFARERRTATTPGTLRPSLYEQCVGSLTSHVKILNMEGIVRLESLTMCRCYKGSTFSSVILPTEPPVLPELLVRSHRFRRIRLKNHQMVNKLSDLHLGNALFLNEMLTNSFFAPFNHNYTATS